MRHARTFVTLMAALAVLFVLSACGGDSPEPTPASSLSTPTAEPDTDPTPSPEPTVTVTQADIEKAVQEALEEKGTEITASDVELPSGVDADSVRTLVEDELARAVEAAGDETEGDDDESEPDVLFRFMNAVNTLYAGQNEESIPAFDLIIRVHPEMPRAYYYRGVAFYRSELNDQAMADFEKSIELDPESGDTYLQRGLLHYDTGDKQAALDDFNTAIDLAPWLADAYRNRGTLLINNGQAAPGRADLERALEIYLYERSQERVEEVRELLNNPPTGEVELFKATDILPRLP